ncbi:Dihydrodipicolinate synthase-like protein [Cryphonectria parasitica EP155]|uniref:Dihydrodipicolinate synthase-like protein n=1 Tax=Cryphonectria parasitica (strain ATCC 38755 / EP155) TaxID=660469 RepID=A0A9P4XWL4_CRYP1|nr:Dihydrodipicolinate synthase-like protein [Cryphonectria parasitica EP155]KAF3762652.1 Dihydrodipicolinate synthase-like protein [Cryphonectria parasitica EP155]
MPQSLKPGVYVPTPTFFHDDADETIDLAATARHAVRLAQAGVTGLAVQGSSGEAVHLLDKERASITHVTRTALDEAGFTSMPIIVGTGAQSTRQTIAFCQQAALARGDAVLVLPPAYYSRSHDHQTFVRFFKDVAAASPLPVLVYNYPGATGGLDLSSDELVALGGPKHPNIVGAKFTCGNTGKLGRVAATLGDENFLCFAGSGDFLVPALSVGAAGVIGGIANVAPKTVVKVYEAFRDGRLKEAQEIQKILGRGDWNAIQWGIPGIKACLQEYEGYGGWGRKPLVRLEGEAKKLALAGFKELMDFEKSL